MPLFLPARNDRFKLLIIFLLGCFLSAARPVSYVISPVFNGNEQLIALRVELECTGDGDGETPFQIPSTYAGTQHLYRHISRMRCFGSRSLVIRSDSVVAVALHAGGNLKLVYEVSALNNHSIQALAGQPFLPLMGADQFQILGAALFVVPVSADGYEVSVVWKNFPVNWNLYNSFGINEKQQKWTSPDSRWLSSVFAGGVGWQVLDSTVNQRHVSLVSPAKSWAFAPQDLLNLLTKIAGCRHQFLNETERNDYTVILVPLQNSPGKNPVAYTGSALHHSMVAYIDPLQVKSAGELLHFFSHEMMHEWIGGKIRCGSGPDDMKTAWFSEGFTEYFALLSQREGGLITAAAFDSIAQYDFSDALAKSPVIHATNDDIAKGFFDNPDLRRLPYLRGFVFAKEMDDLIRKKSGGKKTLKDAVKTCEAAPLIDDKNLSQFLNLLSVETGKPVNQWFKRFILEGEYPMK